MKKKQIIALVTAAAATAMMLTACGSATGESSSSSAAQSDTAAQSEAADAKSDASSENTSATDLSGTVATNGSTSMEEVIGALSEQFMADNQGVTVTYDATGSGTGIEAVNTGSCDIGLSSRKLKDEETSNGLVATTVALDGIAIIVNADNPIKDLSVDQIASIFKVRQRTGARLRADRTERSPASAVRQVPVREMVLRTSPARRTRASWHRN
jgi:phosphate transport system substrate-binding protein